MSLFFCVRLGATDLLVNNTGAPNTYATLAAAINAANDGDRILLEPNIPIFESVSIDKSLEIVSTAVDTAFNINGTVTIIANANKEIKLVGAHVNALSFSSGTADSSSLCKFYFIDSKLIGAAGIDSQNMYVETNVLFCDQLDRRVEFDYGKIIASDIKGFISNVNGKIIANNIDSLLSILNGSYLLANNSFYHSNSYQSSNSQHQLIINGSINSTNTNYIINNRFYSYSTVYGASSGYNANIYINSSANNSEISILNNSFWLRNDYYGYKNIFKSSHPSINVLYNNFYNAQGSSYLGVSGSNNFMNYSLYFNNSSSYANATDEGHPGIRYFDIDMSRNDIGIYGGPYSWNNYWGSSTGKGVVYDLDMPFEYWTGQSATINAKAAHQK
tara:strand:+ start:119 stop:1282 length:1164 start_codon:yes stop_codon:yes gene_type:complete